MARFLLYGRHPRHTGVFTLLINGAGFMRRPRLTKMSRLKAIIVIAVGLILPLTSAIAQGDVSWQTIKVQGGGKNTLCSPDSVFTSSAGNSASFVFTNFAINLAAGAPHSDGAEFGACRIVTRLTIPKGYYLAGLSQSTLAGVIKTAGARGEVRTKLALKRTGGSDEGGTPAMPGIGGEGKAIETRIRFAPRDEMNQPMLLLNGSFVTPPSAIQHICRFTRQTPVTLDINFRASIKGQRKTPGASIIIAIDSSDVQLDLGAQLGKCP